MEVGGGLTRLAMGAGHCRCGHFSPAQPWAIVRQAAIGHAAPTDCLAIDYPRRALLPGRRWRDALFEGPFQSSFQACLYDLPSGWARLLPTARFNEHRLSKNTIGLVCALGEQRKLPSLPIHYLRSQAAIGPCGFHPFQYPSCVPRFASKKGSWSASLLTVPTISLVFSKGGLGCAAGFYQ